MVKRQQFTTESKREADIESVLKKLADQPHPLVRRC